MGKMTTFIITLDKKLHLYDFNLKTLEMRDLTIKGGLLYSQFDVTNLISLTSIKSYLPLKRDNQLFDVFLIGGFLWDRDRKWKGVIRVWNCLNNF